MKTNLITALLCCVVALTSCKDDKKSKPAENSIVSFLTVENGIEIYSRTSGPWELGTIFSATVPGKITHLGSKMPEPGSYRIIVWDFDSKIVLRQKTTEQTAPDVLALANIEELILEPNKKYVISINSQVAGVNKRYSYAAKTSGGDFMPYTKGSILVHNASYKLTNAPEFPNQTTNIKNELYGFAEFTFIPD